MNLARDPYLLTDGTRFSDAGHVTGGGWLGRNHKVLQFLTRLLSADLGYISGFTESPLAVLTPHYHRPQVGMWVPVVLPITTRTSLRSGSHGLVLT